MPDLPIGSSAAPARYQTMWVTTAVRWSGITTISIPFASENWVTDDAGRDGAGRKRRQRGRTDQ